MRKLNCALCAIALSVAFVGKAEAVRIEGTTRASGGGRTWAVPASVQVIEDRTGNVVAATTSGRPLWLGSWVQGYSTNAPDRVHLTIRAVWRDPHTGRYYEGVARRAVLGNGGRAVVNLNLFQR